MLHPLHRQVGGHIFGDGMSEDENTRGKLCQMVNYARAKGKPGDNFFEAIGVSPDDVEEWRAIPDSELTEPEDMGSASV